MLLDRSIMFLLSYDPILCPQGFLCQAAFLSACEIFFELATEYCGENEEAKKMTKRAVYCHLSINVFG